MRLSNAPGPNHCHRWAGGPEFRGTCRTRQRVVDLNPSSLKGTFTDIETFVVMELGARGRGRGD